jgi:hypothetical protein
MSMRTKHNRHSQMPLGYYLRLDCDARNKLIAQVFVPGLVFAFLCAVVAIPANAQPSSVDAANATLSTLNGEAIQGRVMSADQSKIVFQANGKVTERLGGEVSQIVLSNRLETKKQPIEVSLVDGSKLLGERLQGSSSGFQLQGLLGGAVAIPAKALRSVKLREVATEQEDAWQAAIKETKDSDAVIVARPGNALDRINGIILEVGESEVGFELDGQKIQIPFSKLLGLVWFQRAPDRVKPAIELITTNRSMLYTDSFSVTANEVNIQTIQGIKIGFPLSSLSSVNYAAANIRWLSELEPMEAKPETQIGFQSPVALLEKSLSPRFVVNGRAPTASSVSADKDLLFPSPGRFVFRVPEGFSTLQAVVQRTDTGTQRSDLTIEVWQEDNRIAQIPLPAEMDFTDIQVPVPAGKKVKLAVVCSAKLMIGTEVQWKQPRLKR